MATAQLMRIASSAQAMLRQYDTSGCSEGPLRSR
jgi:hypothetical protein